MALHNNPFLNHGFEVLNNLDIYGAVKDSRAVL